MSHDTGAKRVGRDAHAQHDHHSCCVTITGIIHVGASVGQEVAAYSQLGVPVLLFEPLQQPFLTLSESIKPYPIMVAVNLALGDFEGEIAFYESDKKGVSSSPLKPTKHKQYYPMRNFTETTCQQTTLDAYLANNIVPYNQLVLDVQGAELHVLRGAMKTLKQIDTVIAEVWNVRMYDGCPLKEEVDAFWLSTASRTCGANGLGNG